MACVKIEALNLKVSFTKTTSIGPNISNLIMLFSKYLALILKSFKVISFNLFVNLLANKIDWNS